MRFAIKILPRWGLEVGHKMTFEVKHKMEQVKLIAELEPEEKKHGLWNIDTFLTKKKFKDFFAKNISALKIKTPS